MRRTPLPGKNSIWKHWIYLFKLYGNRVQKFFMSLSHLFVLFGSLGTLTLLIYQFGFIAQGQHTLYTTRPYLLDLFILGIALRYLVHFKEVHKEKFFVLDILLFILICGIRILLCHDSSPHSSPTSFPLLPFFLHPHFSYTLLLILSAIHLSRLLFVWFNRKIKPSLIFIFSFLALILIGAGLLSLPQATYNGISFIDALFTSTTSVCVTGLTTVNVADVFTFRGQLLILLLIQVGGIGVITFTSFFALSFMGNTSVNSQLALKDLFNEEKIGNLFKVLISIIFVSFLVEAVGAYLIFHSIQGTLGDPSKEIYLSVFHAISAYCNAGISPLPNNIGSVGFLYNHSFHFWISCLIVLGGLGFPIVFNLLRWCKHTLTYIFKKNLRIQERYEHHAHIVRLHTRLAIGTTLILLLVGTVLFFLFERNKTLSGLPLGAQWIESFFYATTPRTAGFITYPTQFLSSASLLLTLLLMMIGASPMSTGGGIKTTTIAVAALTTLHIVRHQNEVVEVKGRSLGKEVVHQAFAIIILFLLWVFLITILLCLLEPHKDIFSLLFETVSATATVGSSMGITEHLSSPSKILLILSMFVGRIGILTFFIGITPNKEAKRYSFPSEKVLLT